MSPVSYYNKNKLLGIGAYSNVFGAGKFAIKKFNVFQGNDISYESIRNGFLCEVSTYKLLEGIHGIPEIKNIVANAHTHDYSFSMPMYRSTLGKLYNSITPEKIKLYIYKILLVLAQVHNKLVVHCDIKPSNIMVDNDDVFVIDWGISRQLYGDKQYPLIVCQTQPYKAPEVFLQFRQLSPKTDIWSVGIILLEMMLGEKNYFLTGSERETILKIFVSLGIPTDPYIIELNEYKEIITELGGAQSQFELLDLKKICDSCKLDDMYDLLVKMLEYDPNNRISASDAINHECFDCFTYAIPFQTQMQMKQSMSPGFYSVSSIKNNNAYAFNNNFRLDMINTILSIPFSTAFFSTTEAMLTIRLMDIYMSEFCVPEEDFNGIFLTMLSLTIDLLGSSCISIEEINKKTQKEIRSDFDVRKVVIELFVGIRCILNYRTPLFLLSEICKIHKHIEFRKLITYCVILQSLTYDTLVYNDEIIVGTIYTIACNTLNLKIDELTMIAGNFKYNLQLNNILANLHIKHKNMTIFKSRKMIYPDDLFGTEQISL